MCHLTRGRRGSPPLGSLPQPAQRCLPRCWPNSATTRLAEKTQTPRKSLGHRKFIPKTSFPTKVLKTKSKVTKT